MVEQSQGGEKKGYHEVEGKDMIIPIITFGSKGKRKKEKLIGASPAYLGPIFVSKFCPKLYSPPLPSHIQELTTLFVSPRQFLIFHLIHEAFLNELLSSIWFRSVRPRFEYQIYVLCDLNHDTFKFSSPQFPQLQNTVHENPCHMLQSSNEIMLTKVVSFNKH